MKCINFMKCMKCTKRSVCMKLTKSIFISFMGIIRPKKMLDIIMEDHAKEGENRIYYSDL